MFVRRKLWRLSLVSFTAVYGFSLINKQINDWKMKSLYEVYKEIDNKEEAEKDYQQILTLRHQRQAAKAVLGKYKFDPQSYH